MWLRSINFIQTFENKRTLAGIIVLNLLQCLNSENKCCLLNRDKHYIEQKRERERKRGRRNGGRVHEQITFFSGQS